MSTASLVISIMGCILSFTSLIMAISIFKKQNQQTLKIKESIDYSIRILESKFKIDAIFNSEKIEKEENENLIKKSLKNSSLFFKNKKNNK